MKLWKEHNISGLFNDEIGIALAVYLKRPEEAAPFLSDAFLNALSVMVDAAAGIAFLYGSRGDYASAREICGWTRDILDALNTGNRIGFMDKVKMVIKGILAYAQLKEGDEPGTRASLEEAAGLAERFDAAPDYGLGTIRFVPLAQESVGRDSLGETAGESMETLVRQLDDKEFTALWKEVKENGRIG